MDNPKADIRSVNERATTARASERELVFTRTIHGPAPRVFDAWTRAETFQRWWVPKAAPITLVSCELDVRVGGRYHLVFGLHDSDQQMAFFGRYLEVVPHERVAWTNEEGDEAGAVTTVTFHETDGRTRVTVHDLYPSKEALDEAIASGSTEGMPEQLEQLNELITHAGDDA
jgi:uncharacterized protein YndB with AHSA1/START domain